MKALVTGATGFLGSHLVDRLLQAGHEVRCLARNPEKAKRLMDLGLEIAWGDLRNPESLKAACRGIDCVFHAAAKVSDWGPWREFEENTVKGTENMLQAAVQAGVPRFLQVSTIGVYDRKLLRPGTSPVREEDPLTGGNDVEFYSKAKMMAEKSAVGFHNRGEIAVTVIRPSTIYGPRDEPTILRLIQLVTGPFAVWIGDYNPDLGMVYVTDVADLCVEAAVQNVAIGRVYNAGPGFKVPLREFIVACCRALDLPVPGRAVPYWLTSLIAIIAESVAKLTRKKEPPILTRAELEFLTILEQHCDISRAKRELGWQPKVGLEEGIRATAEWARAYLGQSLSSASI